MSYNIVFSENVFGFVSNMNKECNLFWLYFLVKFYGKFGNRGMWTNFKGVKGSLQSFERDSFLLMLLCKFLSPWTSQGSNSRSYWRMEQLESTLLRSHIVTLGHILERITNLLCKDYKNLWKNIMKRNGIKRNSKERSPWKLKTWPGKRELGIT